MTTNSTMIDFEGHLINPDDISAITPVIQISYGSMHCSWEYGFKVILKNAELEFTVNDNPYRARDLQKKDAEKKRNKLLQLLNLN